MAATARCLTPAALASLLLLAACAHRPADRPQSRPGSATADAAQRSPAPLPDRRSDAALYNSAGDDAAVVRALLADAAHGSGPSTRPARASRSPVVQSALSPAPRYDQPRR